MIDIVREIEAVQREVGTGRIAAGEGRAIRLRRTYDAPIDDVWDALTNPDRIGRWFLPISGDYRLGGRYQFEGNAGGEIVACERPNRLRITWAYGEVASDADVSELEVRLSSAGDEATVLELEHTAILPDEMWIEYGPGAVGVGWDQGALGLALHLRGESVGDPTAWQCPTKDARSRPGAARRGARRTRLRARIQRWRRGVSRIRRCSTRRHPNRRPEDRAPGRSQASCPEGVMPLQCVCQSRGQTLRTLCPAVHQAGCPRAPNRVRRQGGATCATPPR